MRLFIGHSDTKVHIDLIRYSGDFDISMNLFLFFLSKFSFFRLFFYSTLLNTRCVRYYFHFDDMLPCPTARRRCKKSDATFYFHNIYHFNVSRTTEYLIHFIVVVAGWVLSRFQFSPLKNYRYLRFILWMWIYNTNCMRSSCSSKNYFIVSTDEKKNVFIISPRRWSNGRHSCFFIFIFNLIFIDAFLLSRFFIFFSFPSMFSSVVSVLLLLLFFLSIFFARICKSRRMSICKRIEGEEKPI